MQSGTIYSLFVCVAIKDQINARLSVRQFSDLTAKGSSDNDFSIVTIYWNVKFPFKSTSSHIL